MNGLLYEDTEVHFSTSWVIEQVMLKMSELRTDKIFIPAIVATVNAKHCKACWEAFVLAALLGEIKLVSYDSHEISKPETIDGAPVDSKGQYLLWATRQPQ